MSKQLIPAHCKNPNAHELKDIHQYNTLDVAEFFYDSIQGEGIYTGFPAAFLRLKGCVLNCSWCDTTEVWRDGDTYSHEQLFQMIKETPLLDKLKDQNQHLVITGGSPLMQQYKLLQFIEQFKEYFGFMPFIEMENECFIKVSDEMFYYVDCWNNSPKLHSAGNYSAFNPEAIIQMAWATSNTSTLRRNTWFKFVIDNPEADWKEIAWLINESLISPDQVILMPQGQTREELAINAPKVVELAIEKGVRFSNREHIVLWDKKTGV